MTEADIDVQVGKMVSALMRVRRTLDLDSFEALLGSLMAEITLGMELAEEQRSEKLLRRPTGSNIIRFPEPL